MIKSMTGYGRAVGVFEGYTITVELRSVNHRFFDFTPKVYRNYSFLEERLKAYVQKVVSRGKVDCFVQIESEQTDNGSVQINKTLALGYYNALQQLCSDFNLQMDNSVNVLASHTDIFAVKKAQEDEDAIWTLVKTVLDDALKAFIDMREAEGEKLKADVLSRAVTILDDVSFIEQRSPQTVAEHNEKLKALIRELIGDAQVDEQRLLTEAAIYADKIAVAEETVRLRSHFEQLKSFFELNEPIGRKLDFLLQEINREANTIGSKASDIEIARRVINIKAEVEKIREQIQNIE